MTATGARSRRVSALLGAAGLLASLVVLPAAVTPIAASAAAAPPVISNPVCAGYSGLNLLNPYGTVREGWFTPDRRRAVRVAISRSDIDWTKNPYRDSSWQNWMNTLKWMGALVQISGGGTLPGPNGKRLHPTAEERWAALNQADAWTKDYLAHYPAVATSPSMLQKLSMAHRAQFLACLIEAHGVRNAPTWLMTAAHQHATWLAKSRNYAGNWNQGIDQDLGLLTIGCVVGNTGYRSTAVSRLSKAIAATIDRDGVPNEQAPAYGAYQYRLWSNVLRVATACGLPPTSDIPRRISGVPTFLSQATQPDGTFVQIGDTEAVQASVMPGTEYVLSKGTAGTPPADRVAIYRAAGYVFGRSAWYPMSSASFYSLRFGPSLAFHGHNDRTAVTWMVAGKARLVDSGHAGYSNAALRIKLRSHEAHNLLSADQYRGFRSASRPSTLTYSSTSDAADSYVVIASAYGYKSAATGWAYTSQTRSVLVSRNPDVLVVRDVAGGAPKPTGTWRQTTWRQHWHLPVGWKATILNRNTVEAAGGSARTTLIRVSASAGSLPVGLAKSVQAPHIGVVRNNIDVQFPSKGRSTSLLTVIAPFAASQVSVSLSGSTLTVRTPAGTATMTIAADGHLTRTA